MPHCLDLDDEDEEEEEEEEDAEADEADNAKPFERDCKGGYFLQDNTSSTRIR